MAGAEELALTVARLGIGVMLLVAGAAKLHNGQGRFLRAVLGYELVSGSVAALIARWIPWVETLTGLMLIIGFLVPVATIVAFGLFFVFTLAIVRSLLRGMANDCGCLRGMDPVRWRLVYRNVFLMGLALPIYSLGGGRSHSRRRHQGSNVSPCMGSPQCRHRASSLVGGHSGQHSDSALAPS